MLAEKTKSSEIFALIHGLHENPSQLIPPPSVSRWANPNEVFQNAWRSIDNAYNFNSDRLAERISNSSDALLNSWERVIRSAACLMQHNVSGNMLWIPVRLGSEVSDMEVCFSTPLADSETAIYWEETAVKGHLRIQDRRVRENQTLDLSGSLQDHQPTSIVMSGSLRENNGDISYEAIFNLTTNQIASLTRKLARGTSSQTIKYAF